MIALGFIFPNDIIQKLPTFQCRPAYATAEDVNTNRGEKHIASKDNLKNVFLRTRKSLGLRAPSVTINQEICVCRLELSKPLQHQS